MFVFSCSFTVWAIFRATQEQLEIPLTVAVWALFMVMPHDELPFLHTCSVFNCMYFQII